MGRSDSSTQLGSHSGFCAVGHGPVETASTRIAQGSPRRSISAWVLLFFVRAYILFLSPIFGGSCRFHPSCSNYALEAVSTHGARRGAWLAAKRLLRCSPFTKGGFDPVPEILYQEDALREVPSDAVSAAEIAAKTPEHRPTKAVVAETWSAAGSLGVERRL
jgi:putative membrane protein insertion efficiency factor